MNAEVHAQAGPLARQADPGGARDSVDFVSTEGYGSYATSHNSNERRPKSNDLRTPKCERSDNDESDQRSKGRGAYLLLRNIVQ